LERGGMIIRPLADVFRRKGGGLKTSGDFLHYCGAEESENCLRSMTPDGIWGENRWGQEGPTGFSGCSQRNPRQRIEEEAPTTNTKQKTTKTPQKKKKKNKKNKKNTTHKNQSKTTEKKRRGVGGAVRGWKKLSHLVKKEGGLIFATGGEGKSSTSRGTFAFRQKSLRKKPGDRRQLGFS